MDEKKTALSADEKAKIESLTAVAVADECYKKHGGKYRILPIYCLKFIGKAQQGETAIVQAYNVNRQYGRPSNAKILMNIALQSEYIALDDKIDGTVSQTVSGFECTLKVNPLHKDENIEFNVIFLVKEVGNGVELIKAQVLDNVTQVTADKDINLYLPWAHNIFFNQEIRAEALDVIKQRAQKMMEDMAAKASEETKESSEEETTEESIEAEAENTSEPVEEEATAEPVESEKEES